MNKHMRQPDTTAYDTDYFLWSERQAALLRASMIDGLDVENVAEEIESLGKRDRRELLSFAQVLLLHLLKWQFQPVKRSKSWLRSINNSRNRIDVILSDSPSLRAILTSQLDLAYKKALKEAILESDLQANAFPISTPYSLANLLDDEYLPE